MAYDHKKEQAIKREISKHKRAIDELKAKLTKPLNLSLRTLEDYKGRQFRTKRGRVVYEVIDIGSNRDYERDYNFVIYYAKLQRVDNGRKLTIPIETFNYDFVEV